MYPDLGVSLWLTGGWTQQSSEFYFPPNGFFKNGANLSQRDLDVSDYVSSVDGENLKVTALANAQCFSKRSKDGNKGQYFFMMIKSVNNYY